MKTTKKLVLATIITSAAISGYATGMTATETATEQNKPAANAGYIKKCINTINSYHPYSQENINNRKEKKQQEAQLKTNAKNTANNYLNADEKLQEIYIQALANENTYSKEIIQSIINELLQENKDNAAVIQKINNLKDSIQKTKKETIEKNKVIQSLTKKAKKSTISYKTMALTTVALAIAAGYVIDLSLYDAQTTHAICQYATTLAQNYSPEFLKNAFAYGRAGLEYLNLINPVPVVEEICEYVPTPEPSFFIKQFGGFIPSFGSDQTIAAVTQNISQTIAVNQTTTQAVQAVTPSLLNKLTFGLL